MTHSLTHFPLAAVVLAVALVFSLAACAPQSASDNAAAEASNSDSAAQQETSVEPSSTSDATPGQAAEESALSSAKTMLDESASFELCGKPWLTSVIAGNTPAQAPDAKDDLYLHYNYDFLSENIGNAPVSYADNATSEPHDSVTALIKDSSVSNPELEQLRIFYEQASDFDTLEAAGADELRPYLKAVADTSSLEELEQVMLADDFPFTPWINTTVGAYDMRSTINVAIMPNYLFSDPLSGADMYQDTSDATMQEAYEAMITKPLVFVASGLPLVSLADDYEQGLERARQFFELEKTYGKDGDHRTKYQGAEYGAQAQAMEFLSLDELTQACPNFPLKETLAKEGEATGDGYIVTCPEWLASFNSIWTEDNFELLRDMTEIKILMECKDFIAPSYFDTARANLSDSQLTPDSFAYTACDKLETFGQLLAKTYVEHVLPDRAQDDLEKLTNGLIDTYIDLVGDTPWLDAESRENVMDKIDNMALNILAPDGGYRSYESLELVPTSEGGTLLGNYLKLKAYNSAREAELVGQPANAGTPWLYMNPTVQNCFYDLKSNSINIFPGFINSAVYSDSMSAAELLGGIGFTIAHEISHAFDYTGSQFSAYGEPEPIYRGEDADEFVQIRQRLADHISTIEIEPGRNVDGIAVSEEATADLCGLQAVLRHAKAEGGADSEKVFERFAQMWAAVYPYYNMGLLYVDTHPLANLRVNVSAQMCDEFYETYGAAEGDTMYLSPENRVLLWGPSAG